jgi:chromosome segregation ATPase
VFLEKLNSLERTTDAGGNDVKTIETIVERSSQTTKELLSSLEKLRSESYELHSNVKREREAWDETYLRARQLETRLCQKAEELTTKLTEGSNNNNQEITNEMKQQYEEKIMAKTRQNEKLSQVLRETQKNLEEGNKERDHLLQEILLGTGRNKSELRTMDQAERKKLVSGFTQKYLSLKAGTDSLAKAVANLEKERSQISEEKRRVLEQLEKTKKSEYQLERANRRLTEKIQSLSQELADMREQVSNNLRRVGAENWEAQEEKYKEIIRTLKQQLRSSDTSKSYCVHKSLKSGSFV